MQCFAGQKSEASNLHQTPKPIADERYYCLDDNSRSHTVGQTIETNNKLDFEVHNVPAYSPDLEPSYYYLFGQVEMLHKVIEAVHKFLHNQPKTFVEGITKFVDR